MDAISFYDLNSYTALLAAVVNFTLALLVVLRTTRETVYVTFALACLGVAWWNFWDFMVYASGGSVWLPVGLNNIPWKNVVPLGSTLAAAAMFHFTLALVDRLRNNRTWVILAYIMAMFLTASAFAAVYSDLAKTFWTGPGWNLAFFILLFPFIMASIILVALAYRNARGEEEGQWLKYILAAMILQVATGMTDLFQKIFPVLPPLGHLGNVIGPMILTTGVLRHRATFDILAQARAKLDLISRIAAEVAHEVRNPLTAIKGVAQLQADMGNEPNVEKIRQYQGILMEEIERAEDILGSLQDLTKPLRVEKEMVDLNNVLGKTVQLIDPHQDGMKIDIMTDGDLPNVEADPSLLKQVFLNLIQNASEACGQDGELKIRTSVDDDCVKMEFTDKGPGVPIEIRSRILEPFFTTKESGLGLGLMVVSRIIEAHGGRIGIDNVQPGGARITLLIPC